MQRLIFVGLFFCFSLFSFSQDIYTIKSNMKIEGLPDDMAGFANINILSAIGKHQLKTGL